MTSGTQRNEVFRPAIHLDMIDMRDCQCSLVRVELVAWEPTLQSALLALPACLILDRVRDLVPVVWVFRSSHWHKINFKSRRTKQCTGAALVLFTMAGFHGRGPVIASVRRYNE